MKPVMLIILDGWGIREMKQGNAVRLGKTPNYDHWLATQERAIIDTFGEHVGLVPGQMGNSEVGHLNLGAGRVVYQDISRIDSAIQEQTLGQQLVLVHALGRAKAEGKKVHLIGLLGTGGVHSHQGHLHTLLDISKNNQLDPIIHIITDGRDTPPDSGIGFLVNLQEKINSLGVGRISTVSGRYYAMDRDKRWDRTKRAYQAIVRRESAITAASAEEAIKQSYEQDVTDEFIEPTVIDSDDNLTIESGDVVICYNFRADRMRQLTRGLSIKAQEDFDEADFIEDLEVITFTVYEDDLPVKVLFDKEILTNTLADVISKARLKQYHSAETEKYPHVTFFFNGRNEDPFPGEDRKIVPSPKVATYDLQPEMSARELTAETLNRLETTDDDFLLINFANPDMVGHTGSLEAAIKAVECVDECAGQLVEKVVEKGGVAVITADHGNCERMINEISGDPHTYHTVGPVSLFVISPEYHGLFSRGRLADVAPTVLELMGLDQPEEMTGTSLLEHTGA